MEKIITSNKHIDTTVRTILFGLLFVTLTSCHNIWLSRAGSEVEIDSSSSVESHENSLFSFDFFSGTRPKPATRNMTYRWRSLRPKVLPKPKLVKTPEVEREMHLLLKGDKGFIKASLRRRVEHYPIITAIFQDEGLPEELINVALIESGFRPGVKSYAGAMGLWQFTKSTGKSYGLEVSFLHDERKDPILSTIAAARHLRDLYLQYKDWNLVLAAYNAGSGAVDRARTRAGSDNIWQIIRKKKLPLQTRRYVPKFIAATLIVNNLDHYGLTALAQEIKISKKKTLG